MNESVNILDNKIHLIYDFTEEHKKTLFTVYNNDGCATFENRDPNIIEDVDGNEISWKICDELVEMKLLEEDEEAFDVYYEITEIGKKTIFKLKEDVI
jgi:hypothetical protein